MERKAFTNIRSMLGGLARAMNLINPDVEHHHEQTAYFAYAIAEEMGLDVESIHLIIYASLLHDVGSIILEKPASLAEIEQDAEKYAYIGANMLRDLPNFEPIANVIQYCQSSWSELLKVIDNNEDCLECARLSSIIHTADVISSCIRPDVPVLNQVEDVCKVIEMGSGKEFLPEAVDAFLRIKNLEVVWLDAINKPEFLMYFTGVMHEISLDDTVELTKLMSRIIDYRSSFTAMHSAGVAASARELARLAGMSEEDCLKMQIAGNLHDVGKLMVPREILEKPDKLTDEEFNIVKEHPYFTRLILMDIDGFSDIANWAGFHHEKLNGRGYPFHFDADNLDLGSRIMAVADIFSAITEVRPYREGMKKEKAISVLNENAERGDICSKIVGLLTEHYEEVDLARETESREAGKRYFESLEK